MQLDKTDREILSFLMRDGRATHAAIARELGMTGPAVYARVHRMEQERVIRGYSIKVDRGALGTPLIALIRVTTRPRIDEIDGFERFIADEGRVIDCYEVDGEDSYMLRVQCASPEDLRNLIGAIRSLPQVIRTVSSIGLVTLKESS